MSIMVQEKEQYEIRCSCQYVVYEGDNDFRIAKFRAQGKAIGGDGKPLSTFTARGYSLPVNKQLHYVLKGTWSYDKKYGYSFFVTSSEETVERNEAGIVAYLASGIFKGIGERTAKRIYDKLGDETLEILDSEPERLLEVKGIKKAKLEKFSAAYRLHRQMRELIVLLTPYGVTAKRAMKIYERFGGNSVEIIRSNPYKLTELAGIGFPTADEIALKTMNPFSPKRIVAAVFFALRQAESRGNLYLRREQLIHETNELLSKNNPADYGEYISQAGNELFKRGELICKYAVDEKTGERIPCFYSPRADKVEADVAELLLRLAYAKAPIKSADWDEQIEIAERECGVTLADEQREAVKMCMNSVVSVITGGPGTGKTTILKVILNIYKRLYPENEVTLCAPTGRAARRMTESTGFPASTIHKALGLSGFDEREDAERPSLSSDFTVIDEVSMLDSYLERTLLGACGYGTQLLLVGDSDQLPSVGPGAVLAEIIASGVVPVVRLDRVYRQGANSTIAVNARLIRHIDTSLIYDDSFQMLKPENEEQAVDMLVDQYLSAVKEQGEDNVILLTPFRKKGVMSGATEMNARLREIINPANENKQEVKVGGRVFREGDRVMQTVNRDEVSNGDIGKIACIYDRVDEDDDSKETVVDIDFGSLGIVSFERDELDGLDLAYATTVHKSQGSEYHTVILCLLNQHYVMLKRNLVYTAITRAKERVVLVSNPQTMTVAIKNLDTEKRNTLLAARLRREL